MRHHLRGSGTKRPEAASTPWTLYQDGLLRLRGPLENPDLHGGGEGGVGVLEWSFRAPLRGLGVHVRQVLEWILDFLVGDIQSGQGLL